MDYPLNDIEIQNKLFTNSYKLPDVSSQLVAHFVTDFCSAANIFFTSSFVENTDWNSSFDKYPRSLESINWYSSSDADPKAIFKNLANCGSEFLALPSAMFDGTEAAALLIWLTSPYSSSGGYFLVTRYTMSTTLWDFSHTNKSLKLFISKLRSNFKAESSQLIAYSLAANNGETHLKSIPYRNF